MMVSKIRSTRIGARPIEGSSSSSTRGLGHQGPAHGQHLLLAAGEGAGKLLLALLQAREEGVDPFQVAFDACLVLAGECAHLQVLGDGQAAKDAPAFRRLGHAAS